MKRWRRLVVALAAVFSAVVTSIGISAAPASAAALPIDPANGNWPQWTFHSGGNYGLVLDAYSSGGDGSPLQLYSKTGNSNQIWFQEGEAEAYLHPGYDRWLCLGRSATTWGATVQVQNCNGGVLQRWSVVRYSAQYQMITAWDNNSFCIDVPNSNFAMRQHLQMWGCNNTWAQIWPVANCHGDGCENQYASEQDCRTAGASIVADTTYGSDRIYLTWSRGCQAVWATGRRYGDGTIQLRRYTPGNEAAIVEPNREGVYVSTRMFGTTAGDTFFRGCIDVDSSPDHRECTSLF
ncbi:RICIN domain-containing protein [Embleya sp. NPDC055664]